MFACRQAPPYALTHEPVFRCINIHTLTKVHDVYMYAHTHVGAAAPLLQFIHIIYTGLRLPLALPASKTPSDCDCRWRFKLAKLHRTSTNLDL